mmetsp:Transcript_139839/g.447199  ORF Transcript_139839/g.447199 Transcript_139839/m.447199 type:complete len:345 (+) Transcript_139839:1166-2200(+)
MMLLHRECHIGHRGGDRHHGLSGGRQQLREQPVHDGIKMGAPQIIRWQVQGRGAKALMEGSDHWGRWAGIAKLPQVQQAQRLPHQRPHLKSAPGSLRVVAAQVAPRHKVALQGHATGMDDVDAWGRAQTRDAMVQLEEAQQHRDRLLAAHERAVRGAEEQPRGALPNELRAPGVSPRPKLARLLLIKRFELLRTPLCIKDKGLDLESAVCRHCCCEQFCLSLQARWRMILVEKQKVLSKSRSRAVSCRLSTTRKICTHKAHEPLYLRSVAIRCLSPTALEFLGGAAGSIETTGHQLGTSEAIARQHGNCCDGCFTTANVSYRGLLHSLPEAKACALTAQGIQAL